MKGLHHTILVKFDYAAGLRCVSIKGHHGDLTPNRPVMVPIYKSLYIEHRKVISMYKHKGFISKKKPVLKQGSRCPEKFLFINGIDEIFKPTFYNIIYDLVCKIVEVNQHRIYPSIP